MNGNNTKGNPSMQTHGETHRVLQLWESLTPEHFIEEPAGLNKMHHSPSGNAAGLTMLSLTKHTTSFGYQMRKSLEILSDELAQEGEIFRFSLVGGDHGNKNGCWKLYCNGLWVASINQGYAYKSFKDSPTGFIERIRGLVELKEIQPLSKSTINEIHRIEDQFESFKDSLAEASSDSDAFASAWAVFISSLKEEDAY